MILMAADRALVVARSRYAMWPGRTAVCLCVVAETSTAPLGECWYLLRDDGRAGELRPYRVGMFRGER